MDLSGEALERCGFETRLEAMKPALLAALHRCRHEHPSWHLGLIAMRWNGAKVLCPLVPVVKGQDQLQKAVMNLRAGQGEANVTAALRTTSRRMVTLPHFVQRRVVLVSGGVPERYFSHFVTAGQEARNARIRVDCILLREAGRFREPAFSWLADETGGQSRVAHDPGALVGALVSLLINARPAGKPIGR